jgi:hypothetical protein
LKHKQWPDLLTYSSENLYSVDVLIDKNTLVQISYNTTFFSNS